MPRRTRCDARSAPTIAHAGGGHATLVRGSPALRSSVPPFEPQPQALTALSRRLKEQFDPTRHPQPGPHGHEGLSGDADHPSRPPSSPIRSSRKPNTILRNCVHCGFCTATCPTYVELGNELDSPRGRIYLIKDMLENDKPASAEVALHIDRCLSCLSCVTTCPSGVDYMHLIDQARVRVEKTYRRPIGDRLMRVMLAACCPIAAASAWPCGCPFASALRGADRAALASSAAGCAMLRPRARIACRDETSIQLPAPRLQSGGDAAGAGGAPHRLRAGGPRSRHQRRDDPAPQPLRRGGRAGAKARDAAARWCTTWAARRKALALARAEHRGVDTSADRTKRLDAILITASGCGTTIKDYAHMLRLRSGLCQAGGADLGAGARHHRVSCLARHPAAGAAARISSSPITLACSMQHGQGIVTEPKVAPPARRASRCATSPRAISAAARPEPTISCSRRSRPGCATARSRTSSPSRPT